jgi:TolA-binding protein
MRRTIPKVFMCVYLFLFLGCAYYNTFYNAKKFYRDGEKERVKRERTQVVELSPEEEAEQKKSGLTSRTPVERASTTELQNYQKAIEKASKVLEYYPKSKYVDDALFLLGECFFYRREFKKALRKFEEISQLYPNSPLISQSRLFMAKTYLGMEQYDDAERRFRELAEEKKIENNIRDEASYELAGLYFEKDNYELAAQNYETTAKESDNKLFRALSLYRLGVCWINLKKYEDAANVFKEAVKSSPNDDFKAQASFKLGEAQSLKGDYKSAIKTFSDLLSKETDEKRLPRVKLQLANNMNQNGDLKDAVKWYNNIIELHKRTDASARSYFALAEIDEFVNVDYKKAKENYDLVRAEFSTSLIAPIAKERSDNIGTLLDLRKEIAKLEGRAVQEDTTKGGGTGKEVKVEKDDAAINLSPDGMWRNYSGRDRPPPISLTDLTDADLMRAAASKERLAKAAADSVAAEATPLKEAVVDSATLAKEKEKAEGQKKITLSQKYLALAQLLLFSFDKVDSAKIFFQKVLDAKIDSSATARAMYSLSYIYRTFSKDTLVANSTLKDLVDLYPNSAQAEGARRLLGLKLKKDEVDSAEVLFTMAEQAYYDDHDIDKALELFKNVKEKYPDSPYAQKALFAQAWHYEKTMFNLEKAIELYNSLIKDYADSEYAKKAKPKLAIIENERKQKEAKEKAAQDTTAKTASPDSTQATAPAAEESSTAPSTIPSDQTAPPAAPANIPATTDSLVPSPVKPTDQAVSPAVPTGVPVTADSLAPSPVKPTDQAAPIPVPQPTKDNGPQLPGLPVKQKETQADSLLPKDAPVITPPANPENPSQER